MRFLLIFGAFVFAIPSFGGTKTKKINARDCQSYVLAPKGYKAHTRDLLQGHARVENRGMRESELRTFVTTTVTGDPRVIEYLLALRKDSIEFETADDRLTSYAEFLLNTYLLRPGNEALAIPLLPNFLQVYWDDFMFGPDDTHQTDRIARGFGWTDIQTQFIQRMMRLYPDETASAWRSQTHKVLPQMLNFQNVLANFLAAEKYLQYYLRQSSAEIQEDDELFENRDNTDKVFENRERLDYVRDLIAEMEAPISQHSTNALLKFYKIGSLPFPGNGTFIRDEERWRGSEVEFTTPVHLLVYYVRVSRRVGIATNEMQTLLATIKRLKDGLRFYPRPVRSA